MSKIAVVMGLFIGFMFIMFFVVSFMAFDQKKVSSLPSSPAVFSGDSGKALSLDSIGKDAVTIRNSGISVVKTSDIKIFVDNKEKNCFWNFQSVAPNAVAVCIASINCDDEIRLVSGSVHDAKKCPPLPPPLFSVPDL